MRRADGPPLATDAQVALQTGLGLVARLLEQRVRTDLVARTVALFFPEDRKAPFSPTELLLKEQYAETLQTHLPGLLQRAAYSELYVLFKARNTFINTWSARGA